MWSAPGDPTIGKRICRCQIPDKAAKTHLSHPEKRNLREHSTDYGLKAMKAVPRSGETTFPSRNKAHEEPHWQHPWPKLIPSGQSPPGVRRQLSAAQAPTARNTYGLKNDILVPPKPKP